MYTMPQRETVAGEATARSMGSKMRFITGDIAMISPLIRQSFLLSSSTVFMFSIQMASTGLPGRDSNVRVFRGWCPTVLSTTRAKQGARGAGEEGRASRTRQRPSTAGWATGPGRSCGR